MRAILIDVLLLSCAGEVWATTERIGDQEAPYQAVLRIDAHFERALPRTLFGQFLERVNWGGEQGIEAAFQPGSGAVRSDVRHLLREMRIPLMRFPGGTQVDYLDWTGLIDHAPGRAPGSPRPTIPTKEGDGQVTTHFGLDEFFALQRELDFEVLLVINILDGLGGRKSGREAALHNVGMIAYCVAKAGQKLPDGMPDWAAVRARNGHPTPYPVDYVQLGNEWFMKEFKNLAQEAVGSSDPKDVAAWYRQVLREYLSVLREVAPGVKIIVDGEMGIEAEREIFSDPVLREEIDFLNVHAYSPWGIKQVKIDGRVVDDWSSISPLQWHEDLATCLGSFTEPDGQARLGIHEETQALARDLGYQLAMTEWNWNGWWQPSAPNSAPIAMESPAALGAAAYLNAILRHPELAIAVQSVCVSNTWPIGAIRIDSADPEKPAVHSPQGLVWRYYSEFTGDVVLRSVLSGEIPQLARKLHYGFKRMFPGDEAAALDAVVTASKDHVVLHLVNRSYTRPALVTPEFTAPVRVQGKGVRWICYNAQPSSSSRGREPIAASQSVLIEDCVGRALRLPPHSVNLFIFPRVPTD